MQKQHSVHIDSNIPAVQNYAPIQSDWKRLQLSVNNAFIEYCFIFIEWEFAETRY